MKAVVKVAFTDKTNMSDVYYAGDTFEGSEKRIEELTISGHVEPMNEAPKSTRKRKVTAKEQ